MFKKLGMILAIVGGIVLASASAAGAAPLPYIGGEGGIPKGPNSVPVCVQTSQGTVYYAESLNVLLQSGAGGILCTR